MTFIIYNTSLDAWGERPEMAVHLARVIQVWAAIEYELAIIFVILSGRNLALGRLFENIRNIHTSLRMIDVLVRTFLKDQNDIKQFDALASRVRKASNQRNAIVHGFWAIRDDEPEKIYLSCKFPLTLAEAKVVPYTRQRFLDTAKKYLELRNDLVAFRECISQLSEKEPFPRSFLLRKD